MSPAHERGEIIVECLTREKVPYVFGPCGHGNVGLLDAQVLVTVRRVRRQSLGRESLLTRS